MSHTSQSKRFFSGEESWVFTADAVDQLCGHHAALVARALAADDTNGPGDQHGADEHVRLMVYAPRRDAAWLPFDLPPDSGSHALVVTSHRLIMTTDPHRADAPPTCASIPLADILAVEIGQALTLGWFAVRYADAANTARVRSMVFASSGIAHLQRAVRMWCDSEPLVGEELQLLPSRADLKVRAYAWHDAPPFLTAEVLPLIEDASLIQHALVGADAWEVPPRGQPFCTAPAAVAAATDDALFVARSDTPTAPEQPSFAAGVICIPRRRIRGLRFSRRGADVTMLTLTLGVRTCCWQVRVPFGLAASSAMAQFAEHVATDS